MATEDLQILEQRIAENAAHLDAATHRLLTDIRDFDAAGGPQRAGALTCAHWLSWRVGWDLGAAREHARVAKRLGEYPKLDDALRTGEVSYSKLRAVTRVVTRDTEDTLLTYARCTTASQLEKICRKYAAVQQA